MTEPTAACLGIDWGTSNRRAYLLDAQGHVVRRHDDGAGILHVGGDFPASLLALLQTLGLAQADVILSGMVGSRNGWREVPYLPVDQPRARLHDFWATSMPACQAFAAGSCPATSTSTCTACRT